MRHDDGARRVVERIRSLAHARLVSSLRNLLGKRDGAARGMAERALQLAGQAVRFVQQGRQHLAKHLLGAGLADGPADNVQRVDVGGAFPEHAEMSVPHEPGIDEGLDVAIAAPRLHRPGRDRDIVAAGAEFQQRRQQPHQGRRLLVAGFRAFQPVRGEQRHRKGLLGRHHQLEQLPAHQRLVGDDAAERHPAARGDQRLVQASPHHRRGPHAVRKAAQIHLVQHLLEAIVPARPDLAERIGDGPVEDDLARCHGPGAHLVLEAHDPVAVAAAVVAVFRQGEQGEAGRARNRAFRPRQQQGDIGVGAGAEPLVAVEPPFGSVGAVLQPGRQLDSAHVGAARLLRHELRAHADFAHVLAGHSRQETPANRLVAVFPDEKRRGIRGGDRAHQCEFRLHEQVLQDVFRRDRRSVPAEHAGAPGHGMDAEIAETDPLHLPVGGMELDPVLVATEGVARMQHGPVPVRQPGQLVEAPAGDFAEAAEMRKHVFAQVVRQVERQQVLQAPVDVEEVHPVAIRRQRRAGGGRVREGVPRKERGCRDIHGGPSGPSSRKVRVPMCQRRARREMSPFVVLRPSPKADSPRSSGRRGGRGWRGIRYSFLKNQPHA